jgi:repressor LexA
MDSISVRQRQILDFIRQFIEERGYSPSVRDVVKGCDISSTSLAQYHLSALETHGHIRRQRDISRSISLSSSYLPGRSIPFLGTIAAGEPIPVPAADTWVTAPDEVLDIPEHLTGRRDKLYGVKVKGTSMIDALIDDGDFVIMQATSTAEDGEMVAVWLKDRQEVTLKKIYHESGRVCLKPANSLMQPIYCKPKNVEIQGRVVAVFRKLGDG